VTEPDHAEQANGGEQQRTQRNPEIRTALMPC
jgi:hypothetical protein